MSYADSDDDLFDYEPDLDSPKSNFTTSNDNIPSSDDIFSEITNLSSENFAIPFADNFNKIRLGISFHNATHNFFSKSHSHANNKALVIILDKLTNGDFSLLCLFYAKENLIPRRLMFISMMEAISSGFDEASESNPENTILSSVIKDLGLEIDQQHLTYFYNTSLSIARHALAIDRHIYLSLAKKLNIPYDEKLLDPELKKDFHGINDPINDPYMDKIHSSIYKTLSDNGLLEEMAKTFGTNVRLFSND